MKTKKTFQLILGILAVPISLLLISSFSFGACKKEMTKSSLKNIISFTIPQQNDSATIDNTSKTIKINVAYNADLTKLTPTITVSPKAKIVPASGSVVDFSQGPVNYTVTAEDNTSQTYAVTVTKSTEMDKKIVSFVLAEQSDSATFNNINDTVKITVQATADLTKLTPTIKTSTGTTISPASGATEDFSNGPVKYTITASDGSSKVWNVVVNRLQYTGTSIITASLPNMVSFSLSYKQVTIIMPAGTDFTNLAPVFTISPGATISPASGQAFDFSQGPKTYTITAENGYVSKWSVSITLQLFTADNSNIQYLGRIDFTTPTAPRFANAGVYIKANFTGTFCDIVMSDESNMNYISVSIDGQAPLRYLMTQGKATYRVASGLTAGQHTILICKDTEAAVNGLSFYGFHCESLLPVTDMPTRKIECYGNSITCGANMLNGPYCTLVDNGTNWNAANCAYLSYGALTARALNAEWMLTSYSGIGLIHSCCSMSIIMPDVYDRLDLTSATKKWDFTKYVPDVVTICLGQNDGTSNVASANFKNTYVSFINNLRGKYPNASIFCLTSPMADVTLLNAMKTTLTNVVDSVNNAGDSKVYWVQLPNNLLGGCTSNPHPNVAEHDSIASVLETAIKAKMGW